jgi:hypothetical protein
MVTTRPDFFVFHHEFMGIAKEASEQALPVKLYNCTEGGAFIEGYEHQSLKDWTVGIESEAPVSVADLLARSFEKMDWSQREKRLKAWKKNVKMGLRESNRLARECQEQLKNTNFSKLDKVEKKLIHSVQDIPFISFLMQEHLSSQMLRSESIQTSENHNMIAMGLYQLITGACEDCLGLL